MLFVFLLGVFASLVGPGADWNWWGFPANFSLAMAGDLLIAWLLVGVVQAALIKPRAT